MEILSLILFFGFIALVYTLLAKVEIQIEGKHGYAEKLPVTWRLTKKDKRGWLRHIVGGTAYHFYMGLFIISLAQLAFFVGLPWTWAAEMLILSFVAFGTVFEDFMWFMLNPARDDETGKRLYGIRNYRREKISWFSDNWLWFCPRWYWWYLPVGILLLIGAILLV